VSAETRLTPGLGADPPVAEAPAGRGTGSVAQPPRQVIARHFWDYGTAATRLWFAVALIGLISLADSIVRIAGLSERELTQIAGWCLLVALAAAFPIQIPRTKHSIAAGDVVIFLLLASHGPAAAAIAACLEAAIGGARASTRLTSRIASPAAAVMSMTLAGALFTGAQSWLNGLGLAYGASHLLALSGAALLHYVLSTAVLMQIVSLKRGVPLTLAGWYHVTSWVGALYLVSAILAGLLSLNARQFGSSASAVGVAILGLSLALLRAHFRYLDFENRAQEARLEAARLEAEQNQRRFLSAFTHTAIGMAIVSHEGIIRQTNRMLSMLLGRDAAQLLDRPFGDVLHAGDIVLLERHLKRMELLHEETFSIELRCRGADDREIWVSLHCARYDDPAAADAGLIFQVHDITSRRRADALNHIAYHDSLTNLANRFCFLERLSAAIERCRVEPEFRFAVMYMDLDRFKAVNDSLGHAAGDELLKEVARRIGQCVRSGDLVSRLAGDEFAILVDEFQHGDDVIRLGHRLLESLAAPMHIDGRELIQYASIGVTFSTPDYCNPDQIMRDADAAMYRAKTEGRARLAVFDATLREELGNRLEIEAELPQAIANGQLALVYQPLFELESRRLIGYEALARWTHPRRGQVDPDEFISLAEKTGCIGALTDWVIDEALRQLADWQRSASAAAPELTMHVNVSGRDLARPHLASRVLHLLERHRIAPRSLMLELTESSLLTQRDLALRSLVRLRAAGIRICIDDFGVGYSSLGRLSTLPFDCLKIDRSFVMGAQEDAQNTEIIRAVLSLGSAMRKLVIAEGIETPEQLARLRHLGALFGQGFLLGRPMPPGQSEPN
jgi:diguanylate cyclase (GGDEF)-like protein/PAS domain S-box-containing protein